MPTTAPLDVESAYAVVHQKVYAPVFFEKLAADYRVQPRDEAEALEMLTMAAQLRQQYDANLEKQAIANNPLALVRQTLDNALEKQGVAVARANPVLAKQIKQAAANAARQDPALVQAVLSLQVLAAQADGAAAAA